jgi:hypothetical protein
MVEREDRARGAGTSCRRSRRRGTRATPTSKSRSSPDSRHVGPGALRAGRASFRQHDHAAGCRRRGRAPVERAALGTRLGRESCAPTGGGAAVRDPSRAMRSWNHRTAERARPALLEGTSAGETTGLIATTCSSTGCAAVEAGGNCPRPTSPHRRADVTTAHRGDEVTSRARRRSGRCDVAAVVVSRTQP